MEPPGGSGLSWLAGWVLWCVPAGALAGVGLIEFNWGGPPYDGGFLGDLVLFGGFLALGQAPFVAFSLFRLCGRVVEWSSLAGYVAAALSALLWPLVGFVGWTSGSYLEVGFDTPLYSGRRVLAGVLPWLLVGALEGVVFAATLAFVREFRAAGVGQTSSRSGGEGRSGRPVRAGALVACGVTWVLASTTGGLFYEYWASFDVAARQNHIKDAIGAYLEGGGVSENVAYEVASNALAVPILYGIPTGLALFTVYRLTLRES